MMTHKSTVLVVGGNMYLGTLVQPQLEKCGFSVRTLDCRPQDEPSGHGGDLVDKSTLIAACRGVDCLLDLSKLDIGRWDEGELSRYSAGVINLWEAARISGVSRVISLVSDSVVGFYRRSMVLDHLTLPRPDGPAGVIGAMIESMASLYAYKFGIQTMCIRMGTCRPEPTDERMLSNWISPNDFIDLMTMALTADYTCEIVYGVSANPDRWWDNANARRLGYAARDHSDVFAHHLRGRRSSNPVANAFQGGLSAASDFKGDPRRIP